MLDFKTGKPEKIGEYQASMDPPPMPSSLRYYWDGRYWSEPYHTTWCSENKEQAMKRKSPFQNCRYWREVPTT